MAQHFSSKVKVLEDGRVSPPPGSVPTTSIPLTFLDTLWFFCCPMQRLFFYESPHPTSHFMQNIVPKLKTSLSLNLQRFFPFAGSLELPPPPQRPYILFTDGDSIPFVVTESEADFNHLTGDHARHAEELQALVPKLPPPSMSSDGGANVCNKQLSLMAIQVTIFPNAGFSIGITFSHVAADGRAFAHFTKSWASVCRSQGDLAFLNESPPYYSSRDSIQDPHGIWSIFLDQSGQLSNNLSRFGIPKDRMRVTYQISQTNIETLKKSIKRKCIVEENVKEPLRLSTFVVTCAYVWVCLVKVLESETPDDILLNESDHVICHFLFGADCRGRLKLPSEYFGNCLQPCLVGARRAELLEENGIVVAAEAIGRAVKELDGGVLKEADKWHSKVMEALSTSKHFVVVSGSPKFQVYDTDFGWGKPKKSEVAHITSSGSIAIAESKDEALGGVEFGLALSPDELDKFNAIFEDGLLNLCS